MKSWKVTERGRTFKGAETDVHIRKEKLGKGWKIIVDVFDSKIKEPDRAYITSETFPYSERGAKEAERFLEGEAITARLQV